MLGRFGQLAVFCGVAMCVPTSIAQPVAASPRWQAVFPALAGGQVHNSTAVRVTAEPTLVVVVVGDSDPLSLKLQVGARSIPCKVIGHDPVSRLGFVSVGGNELPKMAPWIEDAGANSRSLLQSMEPGGPSKCWTTGWVKQVGGKILPFALLRVNFSGKVPSPGTPLVDAVGRVVGIVFQKSGEPNIGYAIPAEAVRRVQQDICKSGHLTRGWLGLSLSSASPIPEICRVLPNSPAAAAGIRANDRLLSVDTRQVADYGDAANAFFYLIPGKPVLVKVLRDTEQIEFTLTPELPKG